MNDPLLILAVVLLVGVAIALAVLLLRKQAEIDLSPITEASARLEAAIERVERGLRGDLAANRQELSAALAQSRQEMTLGLKGLGDALNIQRGTVDERLKQIQESNTRQLDLMRQTVDEKLQSALERRLGESFKIVSERLEAVHKGLGEMQTLAIGVGDLRKALTNVKTRGVWGEVQLHALLEQVLMPDQYAANFMARDGGDRVEFAVKMPGQCEEDSDGLWLPIDAKFPLEDYQRLVEAQERADAPAAEEAGKQLELRIRNCAATICDKYINPPRTTAFAILFLPTEGLFAEVLRRRGLEEGVRRDFRVTIAGPTTLWAILSGLQMGFHTLAIQRRSSEVWDLLAAVKGEWGKYGELLAKVQKKLQEASNTIDQVETRSRAIGRKLRDVQDLPASEVDAVLMLDETEEAGRAG
ncbi:MAG: DNA recombination protein RmuC [Tepidisphaeraceae bacterium]|jgi:DNA recombination protein RmuC